jgi:cytochrome c oxidase cbb3-type subunit 3
MKFIHYLESIAGIAIYPLISLFLFFLFFTALLIYVLKADKKHITALKNIPLDDQDGPTSTIR